MDIAYIPPACCAAAVFLLARLRDGESAPRRTGAALERDIHLMELRLANLSGEFGDLQVKVAAMRGRPHTHDEHEAERIRQPRADAEHLAVEQREPLLDRLVRKALVNADQVARAEAHRRSAGASSPLEDVLVLLGYITPGAPRAERGELRRRAAEATVTRPAAALAKEGKDAV